MKLLRNRITYRYLGSGGPLLEEPEATEPVLQPRRRLVLLIHGYNTSKRKADANYYAFQQLVRDLDVALAEDCCAFHWTGDSRFRPASALVYGKKLADAKVVAPRLAAFLARRRTSWGARPRVLVIAHSMGCRLILETLVALANAAGASFKLEIVLMGAAVPAHLLEPNGSLSAGLSHMARHLVLFSRSDLTLKYLFTLGQAIAGEYGEAVGYQGKPSSVWREQEETRLGHREYWSSKAIAHRVARWAESPVAPPQKSNELQAWRLADDYGAVEMREVAGAARDATESRSTRNRSVGRLVSRIVGQRILRTDYR